MTRMFNKYIQENKIFLLVAYNTPNSQDDIPNIVNETLKGETRRSISS
jgi:hypothetical protein